ncbi:MAG: hypothetical protein DMG21_20695 [Acidobacteria bacterium]|nr:MAG: hypothetical protein DMG21_20695 [Acidobacteriota bacterium]
MTSEAGRPRRMGRSVVAVLAGFAVVVALSLGTDVAMHAIGIFPRLGDAMSDALFLLATTYRTVYSVAGSYVTARLAPYRPMAHALAGGGVGIVLSVVGAVETRNRGPALGPHWYPLALIVTAMPCAWAGGRLRQWQASKVGNQAVV